LKRKRMRHNRVLLQFTALENKSDLGSCISFDPEIQKEPYKKDKVDIWTEIVSYSPVLYRVFIVQAY
jgi:hypothetical protein